MDTSDIVDSEAPRLSRHDASAIMSLLDTNYAFFAVTMFGLKRQPKQELFGQSALDHRHTIGCFSRQTGKSFALAVLICKWLWLGNHGKPVLVGAYAPKWGQAFDLIFMQVLHFIEAQPLIADEIENINRADGLVRTYGGNEFRIFSAQDTSESRGYRNTIVILDEAQDISNKKRNTEILPTGAAGTRWIGNGYTEGFELKIVETGTPGGRNHFYENISKGRILDDMHDLKKIKDEEIAIVTQPWYESTTISMKTVQDAKREFPENQFKQEYECVFNFDTAFAFTWEQINSTCTQKERIFKRDPRGFYVGGIDLGRTKDHTVLSIFQWKGPTYDMVFHKQWDLNLDWYDIIEGKDGVLQHLSRWKPELTYFDATGPTGNDIYRKLFIDIIDKDLDVGRIKPFIYDPRTKVQLIFNIQRLLQHGWVRMWDEPQLVEQFRILPEDRTGGDLPKFDKPKGTHDDRVHSVGLALMAGRYKFGDEGEKDSRGISFGKPDRSESLWNLLGNQPISLGKVDDGIAVGSDSGLGSVFDRRDIWENL